MADERYRAACEAAIEEVDAFLEKAAEKKKFANMLATMAGIDAPYDDVDVPQASGASLSIRSDQFANTSYPSVAARDFLALRGQAKGAADLDLIYDALVKGGFAFGSTKNDARGGLKIALGKDGLVRRLPNGTYGLWEWYPNAKRDRGPGTARGNGPGFSVRRSVQDSAENVVDESDGDDEGLLDDKQKEAQ